MSELSTDLTSGQLPSLEHLTGVRSSKPRFYAEYRDAAAGLRRSLRALSGISAALSAITSGPDVLARAVLDAVGDLLHPEWALLTLEGAVLGQDGGLTAVRRPDGVVRPGDAEAPGDLRALVAACRDEGCAGEDGASGLRGAAARSLAVPMVLAGREVGVLAAWQPREGGLGESDAAILQILANQAVVAFHTGTLFRQSEELRRHSTLLYQEAEARARDLAMRNEELRHTRQRLAEAQARQILDGERQRIARDLHDSVAQHVLSAGMNVEWCRARSEQPELGERLDLAKQLLRAAVERIRATIFTLSSGGGQPARDLPALLQELGRAHDVSAVRVQVRLPGTYRPLPPVVEHALYCIASEALFNATVHARAGTAAIRLSSGPGATRLTVEDDGTGDPAALRRSLSMAARSDLGGLHRGLANMAERAREVGAVLRVDRARLGGIRISVTVPEGEAT